MIRSGSAGPVTVRVWVLMGRLLVEASNPQLCSEPVD